jgi:hypothetical protein
MTGRIQCTVWLFLQQFSPFFTEPLFRLYDVESVRVFGLDLERGVLISYVSSAAFVVIAVSHSNGVGNCRLLR